MFNKLVTSVIIFTCSTGVALATEKLDLTSDAAKASYGIGINIGNSLKAQSFPNISIQAIHQGIDDSLQDSPMKVSKDDLVAAFSKIQKKEAEEKAKVAQSNLKQGEAFLSRNLQATGVQSTDSGLQYKILKEGKGPKPAADDVVVTNYRGKLLNGTEFDSSYKHKEPVEFPVNRVIPGWTEALQMMPVGSKWELYIPAKLAYGEFSPSPTIPPNSTLIFDVELLSIKGKTKVN